MIVQLEHTLKNKSLKIVFLVSLFVKKKKS
jgi:hypothetical protein